LAPLKYLLATSDPPPPDPVPIHTHTLENLSERGHSALGMVAVFLVVTTIRMTASDEYTVGAVEQRLEDMHRVYSAAAHQTYHP
jgi:hypothetical protein